MNDPFKNIRGLLGTVVFHGVLVALFIFLSFTAPFPPPEEQGIEVNFGTNDRGLGRVEPQRRQYSPPEETVESEETVTPPVEKVVEDVPDESEKEAQDLMTQEFEEAAKIAAQKAREEETERKRLQEIEKKKQEELERQRQAELEKERLEKERIREQELEQQRKAEEERRQREEEERQRNEINQRMQRSFGGQSESGENASEGVREGVGNQGVKTGNVNSDNRTMINSSGNGVSFSLEGRSVLGALQQPSYPGQETGKVVVQITVNKEGRVISAVPGVRGSTTSDTRLYEAAKKAALTARFNKVTDPNAAISQKGTITYVFTLTGS